jgi:hypothetical protein
MQQSSPSWTQSDTIISLLLIFAGVMIWVLTRYVIFLPYFNFARVARLMDT